MADPRRFTGDQIGGHDGFFANNGEQAPAGSQAGLKFFVEHRCRTGQYNHVIGSVAAPATRTVSNFKRDVANIVRGESFEKIAAAWAPGLAEFAKLREPFLLYH